MKRNRLIRLLKLNQRVMTVQKQSDIRAGRRAAKVLKPKTVSHRHQLNKRTVLSLFRL